MLDIEQLYSNSDSNPTKNCANCAQTCQKAPLIYDVLVIGAGAIGCSIARELSKYQLKIAVVEINENVSQGASKANSGIVHGGYDEQHGTVKASATHRGNRLFSQLNSELNFGFREIGSLVLAYSEEDMQKLINLYRNGTKNGVHRLYLLNKKQTMDLEPSVNPEVYASLYCADAGITSPYEYTMALAENAARNGVHFWMGAKVFRIDQVDLGEKPLGFHVHVQNTIEREYDDPELPLSGYFQTRVIINCAGINSSKIAKLLKADNFHILPRKGEYILLDRSQGHLARHVLFPVPNKERGKGILVSPTFHGNLLLGPTSRDATSSQSNSEILHEIVHSARHSVPEIDPRKTITSYTGTRAKCSKRDFIIEESSVKRLVNVAGIDSPGLTCSPMVAKMAVEILIDDCGMDLQPFLGFVPERPAIIQKKSEDWRGTIDDPDPKYNIICRCERVTEAEIVDAIKRPLPAKSVEAVRMATRAGMGMCQGSFCEPRVVTLLTRERKTDHIHTRGKGSSILPHRRVTADDREMLAKM